MERPFLFIHPSLWRRWWSIDFPARCRFWRPVSPRLQRWMNPHIEHGHAHLTQVKKLFEHIARVLLGKWLPNPTNASQEDTCIFDILIKLEQCMSIVIDIIHIVLISYYSILIITIKSEEQAFLVFSALNQLGYHFIPCHFSVVHAIIIHHGSLIYW